MGRLEEKNVVALLYSLHSFPLVYLIFSLCLVESFATISQNDEFFSQLFFLYATTKQHEMVC
jgi:hypothetical protein